MRRLAEILWQRVSAISVFKRWVRRRLEKIKLLSPGEQTERLVETFYIDTIVLLLKIFLIGILGLVGMMIYEMYQGKEFVGKLERNGNGKGTKKVELIGTGANGVIVSGNIELKERQYTREEIQELCGEVLLMLEESIVGDNKSLLWIEESLILPDAVEGYPFSITWKSGDVNILSNEGTLREGYREQEIPLELVARLQYENFEETKEWQLIIAPSMWTEEEIWRWNVEKYLREAEEKTQEEKWLVLPKEIAGQSVSWEVPKDDSRAEVVALTILCAVFVVWGREYDLKRKFKERNRRLEEDYNAMVTRLVLYLGTGLPVKSAWERTAAIMEKITPEGLTAREMRLASREMDSGFYEKDCYVSFGKRCGRQEYIRLGTLLSQNLRKGNSELLKRLREEVKESGEQRKHLVRKKGEEAATKMLGPMMMLLAMTMILIMLPAFMGIF